MPVTSRYDLAQPQSLEGVWPQMPDAVIHLAGQTFVPEAFRDPARPLQINVLGTLNLLQAVIQQSIRSLIEQLADLVQVNIELIQDPARLRRAEQRRVCGSHARLQHATGWTPEITTQQSLRAILSDGELRNALPRSNAC
jgi:nucleoside-diphosphate-sugar epimerase